MEEEEEVEGVGVPALDLVFSNDDLEAGVA